MIATVLVALTKEEIEQQTKDYLDRYHPAGYGTSAEEIEEVRIDKGFTHRFKEELPPMIYQAEVNEINGLDSNGERIEVHWSIITDDEQHFLREINNRIIRHVHKEHYKIEITYKCYRTPYYKRIIKRFESCD